MIIVLKKKRLFTLVAVILALSIAVAGCFAIKKVHKAMAIGKKTIVIDAGHGGIDKGVIGANGTEEASKNLEISKKLRDLLEDAGFIVVMTREKESGAVDFGEYSTGEFKRKDFEKRKKIIEKSNADLLVSVHCNKYPSSSRRGIQVFYNKLSKEGKVFASVMQESLNALNLENAGKPYSALVGDYFMLNCSEMPSIIVECGFLSNAEDEKLLCDEKYIDKLVFSMFSGIVGYFEK